MVDKLVVTLPLPDAVMVMLRERFDVFAWNEAEAIPETTLQDWVQVSDAILCSVGNPISAATIARAAGRLKVISTISVGVDHIDTDAATAAGIPVGHTPGVLTDSTADMALALMLACTRRIAEADRFVRAGAWSGSWSAGTFLGKDLSRSTVGLIGLGPIGQAVAKRVRGFGADVIAWNRTSKDVPGVSAVSLDDLFERSDIVSVHAAMTSDTRHLVSAQRLASMKDSAILINTARGGLVDEQALINELDSGRLYAGLDVSEEEPLPKESPLMGLDNVVLAPHLGSATVATRQAMMERALANLEAGFSDEPIPFCVNPDVYKKL